MEFDRTTFISSLGGQAAVDEMSSEAKADELEDFMTASLDAVIAFQQGKRPKNYPTVAEIEAKTETRTFRRGVGDLFAGRGHVKKLPPMPASPTLADFFELRFAPANHVLQSAALAMKNGMPEKIILACLLHDTAMALIKCDHGWWGAQLYEPYVPEETSFAIRHHQTLRYFPDEAYGYKYPELYKFMFGVDYEPPPHIQANYQWLRNHRWYELPRLVTVNDLYAFDPNAKVTIEPFVDIIGRHFRQPKEGLGNDNSPVAHMWRSIARPDAPL